MSNVALSVNKDGSDGLTHNVRRGRKGTQNGIGRILGYQGLFLGRLPGDHFTRFRVYWIQGVLDPGCTRSRVY